MSLPKPLEIDADNPRWGLGSALAVWVLSVFFVLLVPFGTVVAYMAVSDPSVLSDGRLGELVRSDPRITVVNVIAVLPAHILTLAVAWAVVTGMGSRPFLNSQGWEWGGFKFWHGAVLFLGFFALSAAVTWVIPEQEHELLRMLKSSREVVYAVAAVATLTAPIVEEVVYRGVVYPSARKHLGGVGAVSLVTLLFALVHVPQYMPSYATIILIFTLSLMLTLVRVWTRNLLPCVALHMVFNGLQSARLLMDPSFGGN